MLTNRAETENKGFGLFVKPANEKMADGQALRTTGVCFLRQVYELFDLISWESEISSTSETGFNTYLDAGSTIILCCCGLSCFIVRSFSVFRALISVFNQLYSKKSNLTGTGNGCFGLL